jgi:hypothetical protein
MRRIVCREFGPPEHLRLAVVPDPKPGPGEVLALLDPDIPGSVQDGSSHGGVPLSCGRPSPGGQRRPG